MHVLEEGGPLLSQEVVINKAKVIQAHRFFDSHAATIGKFAEVAKLLSRKVSASGGAERDQQHEAHLAQSAKPP